MLVRLRFTEPLREELKIYGKKKIVNRIKEESRKHRLLRVRIKGLDMLTCKNLVNELRQSLYRASGYIGLQCLSECDWGAPAAYDSKEGYCDYICIPKDFDNLDAQERAVMEKAYEKIEEMQNRYPARRHTVDNDLGYSIFDIMD